MTVDGIVGVDDLLFLLAVFGRDPATDAQAAAADGNSDGVAGVEDLLGLLSAYGRSCESQTPPPTPPPAPPAVSPEEAAAEFEAALAAAATDPATPQTSIFSAVAFQGDFTMVAEGFARAEFEEGFQISMAGSLGDGATVTSDMVVVDDLRAGGIEVLFHIDVPATLADTAVSLVQTLMGSGQTIELTTSSAVFVAETSTMATPSVAPAIIDCAGSWVADGECSEPCGAAGVANFTYAITRVAQNGGAECAAAGGDTDIQPCNTQVQCPVDCDGIWNEWSACPVPCGGGTSIRTYTVLAEAQHGGACPLQDAVEEQDCNTDACPPPPAVTTDCVGGARPHSRYHGCWSFPLGPALRRITAESSSVRLRRMERIQRVQPLVRASWQHGPSV